MRDRAKIKRKSFRLLVKEVADYIGNYFTKHGVMPYNKEIIKHLGREAVHLWLAKKVLIQKGILSEVRHGRYIYNAGIPLDIESIEPPADTRTSYDLLTRYIPEYTRLNGHAPSYQEMAIAGRCNPSDLSRVLAKMQREGIVVNKGKGNWEWVDDPTIPSAHRPQLKRVYGSLVRACENHYKRYRKFPSCNDLDVALNSSRLTVQSAIKRAVKNGELEKDDKGHIRIPSAEPPVIATPTEQQWAELDSRDSEVLKAVYSFYEQNKRFPYTPEIGSILGRSTSWVCEAFDRLILQGHLTLVRLPKKGYGRRDFFFPPYRGYALDVELEIVSAILEHVVDSHFYPTMDYLLKRLSHLDKHQVMVCIGHLTRTGVLRQVKQRYGPAFVQLTNKKGEPVWLPNLGRAKLSKQGPRGKMVYEWALERYNTQGIPFTNAQACLELNTTRALTSSALGILKGYGFVRSSGFYLLPCTPQAEPQEPTVTIFDTKRLSELFNVSSDTSERIMKRIGRKWGNRWVAPQEAVIRYGKEYGYLL